MPTCTLIYNLKLIEKRKTKKQKQKQKNKKNDSSELKMSGQNILVMFTHFNLFS